MKFISKKKLLAIAFACLATQAITTNKCQGTVPAIKEAEAMIVESFNNAKTFADFIDTVIKVLQKYKDEFIRTRCKNDSNRFNNLLVALKSIRNATDTAKVQKKLAQFRDLLPDDITEIGQLRFATRVKTLLYYNK